MCPAAPASALLPPRGRGYIHFSHFCRCQSDRSFRDVGGTGRNQKQNVEQEKILCFCEVGFVLRFNSNTRKAWRLLGKDEPTMAHVYYVFLGCATLEGRHGDPFTQAASVCVSSPPAHMEAPCVGQITLVSPGRLLHTELQPCSVRRQGSPLPEALSSAHPSLVWFFFFLIFLLVKFHKTYVNSANVICCLTMERSSLWGKANSSSIKASLRPCSQKTPGLVVCASSHVAPLLLEMGEPEE